VMQGHLCQEALPERSAIQGSLCQVTISHRCCAGSMAAIAEVQC
jgi:hypothetical protein